MQMPDPEVAELIEADFLQLKHPTSDKERAIIMIEKPVQSLIA